MKIKIKVDPGGNAYVAAIDPATGEHRRATTVRPGQEVELDIAPDADLGVDQIGFGGVIDSESGSAVSEPTPASEPADTPGGGNEGAATADGDQGEVGGPPGQTPEPGTPGDQTTDPETEGANAGSEGTSQPPAGDGELGAPQTGEQPTTSAASEKPLYLVDGEELPAGFEPSGLETPDGRELYHFAEDEAGVGATGNRDGVSVYADAEENDKPVQAVTGATDGEGSEREDAERSAT